LWQVVSFATNRDLSVRRVSVRPVGGRSMQQVNPTGYLAVLGSDEHRKVIVTPVAVTDEEPMVS
jgi:hypothetical protein